MPKPMPKADAAEWVRTQYGRLGHGAAARDEELVSPSPRPPPREQRSVAVGPPRGGLSEEALAQYRGQGEAPRSRNATLLT